MTKFPIALISVVLAFGSCAFVFAHSPTVPPAVPQASVCVSLEPTTAKLTIQGRKALSAFFNLIKGTVAEHVEVSTIIVQVRNPDDTGPGIEFLTNELIDERLKVIAKAFTDSGILADLSQGIAYAKATPKFASGSVCTQMNSAFLIAHFPGLLPEGCKSIGRSLCRFDCSAGVCVHPESDAPK